MVSHFSYQFSQPLRDSDFSSNPMVLLLGLKNLSHPYIINTFYFFLCHAHLGQYSVGKVCSFHSFHRTDFIQHRSDIFHRVPTRKELSRTTCRVSRFFFFLFLSLLFFSFLSFSTSVPNRQQTNSVQYTIRMKTILFLGVFFVEVSILIFLLFSPCSLSRSPSPEMRLRCKPTYLSKPLSVLDPIS